MRLDGTLFVSTQRAFYLYVGPLVATTRHAHHAAQVILAPSGIDLEDAAAVPRRACTAILPPRSPHRHGACAHAAMLFLDGDDVASRALAAPVWDPQPVTVPACPTGAEARVLAERMLAKLGPGPAAPRHPATRRMCALLDQVAEPADLARLSREAGLSPRQMRHAFTRDVGLKVRAYVRWRRVLRAVSAVESGESLSAAAAHAGFADSAHLSRVFREQFGLTPSDGLHALTWRTLDAGGTPASRPAGGASRPGA